MFKHLKVVPLAAESLGVRSMCTLVETPDLRILLDAGVSLCPNRFGLPPHPLEFRAIRKARKRIAEAADTASVITLSHYHFDHHTPSYEDWLCNWTAEDETAKQIYQDKVVLMKNPREWINFSQRRRGWVFQKTSGKYAKKLEVADGRTFTFGRTTIRFSEPVPHGPEDSALGWVLMITIEYGGERFLFAPDVQGPISIKTLERIVTEKPQLIMVGGPPSYLAGFKVNEEDFLLGMANLEKLVESVPHIILEHHLLRDERWREKAAKIFEKAERVDHKIFTAAEFLGLKNNFLEAIRRRLFEERPPSKDFEKWMKMGVDRKKKVKPPI
jgi:predicted metallo-beta-lactamase superfamily hydrolase